jgi:hypothetical protein
MGSRSPEREKKLAEALRANLKRRKEAARRAAPESPQVAGDDGGHSPKSAKKPA